MLRLLRHAGAVTLAVLLCAPPAAAGEKSLDDYRLFRALAIDLLGRMPTRDEVAAFEAKGFDLDAWIDGHLEGPTYTARLTRIYMDLLRLEANPAIQFAPDATTLRRTSIQGPDKKPVFVFWRARQRRGRDATDGEFCLTKEETGLDIGVGQQAKGEAKPVPQAVLDANTVLVRPWWLYRDYLNVRPSRRFKMGWDDPDPAYRPVASILNEPDGKTPAMEVRVCREEAQATPMGHVYVTGRAPPPKGEPPPFGRKRPLPLDSPYAKAHKGETIACGSKLGVESSIDCGCGVGLEHCLPSDSENNGGGAFEFPNHAPLGIDQPLDDVRQSASRWYPFWWSQEAVHFFDYLFAHDRDFRDVLTAKYTVINGPLAQFYRAIQPGNCCGAEASFGMLTEEEPLFQPSAVPNELFPHDVRAWTVVPDRGPHASGLLTMPIFLEKYASARARGATLYTAFLCKSFVAENAELNPSTEPNLMVRPGCSTCHATLEPLAAYFARIEPGNLVYLPETKFPAKSDRCKKAKNGSVPGNCNAFYDAQFADEQNGILRSAYGSLVHADAAAAGAGRDVTASRDFATCTVQRVATSFLGRPLGADDGALAGALEDELVKKGYRIRPLVRAILKSDAYRRANNLSSTTWRGAK